MNFFPCSLVCLLPERDKLGRPVLLFRIKDIVLEGNCLLQDFMSSIAMLTDSIYDIEEYMIRGMVYILDMAGLKTAHLQIVPINKFIKIGKNGDRCIVGRHKGFHIINHSTTWTFLINLGLQHVPTKIKERVKFYSSIDDLDIVSKKSLPLVS